jgi:diguanylate cyclase (GGDEF)-like protein
MPHQPGPLAILLVEDDPHDASEMRRALAEEPGFALTVAGRLEEALDVLTACPIAATLLDLTLPDADGLTGVDRLVAAAPDVPVIALASVDDDALALGAVRQGAQDYLVKGAADRRRILRAIHHAIERHRAQRALQRLVGKDSLTGLENRRGFLALAEQHVRLARRGGRGGALVLSDVDGLKAINDTWGHAEGDRVLTAAAGILRMTFRDSDIVARLGGDEFVALAVEATQDSAEGIRRRLDEALQRFNGGGTRPWSLSLSAGIALLDLSRPTPLEHALAEADRSLYAHKRGRPPEAFAAH